MCKTPVIWVTSCFLIQDDANNDPQWSEEQLLEAKFCLAGLTIGQCEVDIMNRSTVAIFEILEKAWATQNCTLVDMKVGTALCWLRWYSSMTAIQVITFPCF